LIVNRSLRINLLLRLGIGIFALLVLDAVACYYTALHFANLVYDRWLVDSTRSLAKAIHDDHGHVSFALTREAVDVFRFDAVDKTFFRIATAEQGFVGGDRELVELHGAATNEPYIATTWFHGQRIRQVMLQLRAARGNDVISISVAETLVKRATLAREILLAMVAPQVALLAIALSLSWLGIARGLKPLTDLAAALEARDHDNLSPIAETGLPREARVLVARINELLKRIGKALQAQRRFVADAAHQLRTPIAAVMLHAERAERAVDFDNAKLALQALHKSVQRTARLSQQLLILARAEPDAAGLEEFTTFDLSRLARQVGEEWIPIALQREADFGLSVPDHPVFLRGNVHLLGEMISNLIDNALRYGGANNTVTLSVHHRDSVQLVIEDSGPGIPQAERDKIFERFYRPAGSPGEGCGLGLAIVLEIARLHGAGITVDTGTNGNGARFAVRFQTT